MLCCVAQVYVTYLCLSIKARITIINFMVKAALCDFWPLGGSNTGSNTDIQIKTCFVCLTFLSILAEILSTKSTWVDIPLSSLATCLLGLYNSCQVGGLRYAGLGLFETAAYCFALAGWWEPLDSLYHLCASWRTKTRSLRLLGSSSL